MHKIKRLPIYLMLFIGLMIHMTVLDYVKIFNAKPDILLMVVVFAGLFSGWRRGLETGLAAGIIKDLFTIGPFWTNAFILGATGLAAGVLSAKFFKESKTTQFFFVFLLGITSLSIRSAVTTLSSSPPILSFTDCLFFFTVPASLYTALLSIPVFSRLMTFYGIGEEDADLL